MPATPAEALIDERALSKLRWRCRRGLLENDLLIERLFSTRNGRFTEAEAQGLMTLMDLSDNDLLDLLLSRREPEPGTLDDRAWQVLREIRSCKPVRPAVFATPGTSKEIS